VTRIVRALVGVEVAAALPIAEVVGGLVDTGSLRSDELLPEFAVLRAGRRDREQRRKNCQSQKRNGAPSDRCDLQVRPSCESGH